jgi:ATP-binding cassette, subfamily B, bacterial
MVKNLLAVIRLLPRVHLGKTLLFAIGVLAASVLPLAVVVFTGLLVGSIPEALAGGFDSTAGQYTISLLVGMAVLIVLMRVNNPLLAAVSTSLGRDVERYLQEVAMAAVGRPAGIAHLEEADTLDRLRIVRALGMDNHRPSLAVTGLASVLPSWIQSLGAAAFLLWFQWWLGLAWLVMWPVLVYYMQREYLKVGQVGYGQSKALRRAEYLRDLAMTAAAAKEIRIWGMLDWLLDRFEAAWLRAIKPVWEARRPSKKVIFGTSGAIVVINLVSYGLLAWAAIQGDLSLAALAVFTQALFQANVFTAFNDDNANLSFAAVTVPKVLELDTQLKQGEITKVIPAPQEAPRNEIRFEDVVFQYPGSEQRVLNHLNLAIPAERSLAIVGENGAGKTSLVKLLCGLYEPTSGRITVDGITLSELHPETWRTRVAVLFQDFARYQLPVADNIAFGAPELAGDLDRLRAAAGKAGALELIESLPQGWDTILSPEYIGGVDLSGGQWQRIALARALFAVEGGAQVLILDEPTAALDVRAEADLYNRFLEITKGLTTILISHRFSTVRRADRIVLINEGTVAEEGTHQELQELGGRYAEMFRLQAARFSESNGNDKILPLFKEASDA